MNQVISAFLLTVVSYCALVSYIPQVCKLIKTKSAGDLSVTTQGIWILSGVCYTVYTVLNFDIMLFLSGVIKLFFNVLIFGLTLYYNHKARKRVCI